MNKPTIEQELLGTARKQQKNEAFVRTTMELVKVQKAAGTFERVLRTTSTNNKESLIMKLKRLPRFALIGIATIGILSVSGAAYAAHRLWTNPSADIRGSVIELQSCRRAGDHTVLRADAKSSMSPDEIAQVLKAHCEISNVQQWAMRELQVQPGNVIFPYTVAAMNDGKLMVKGEDGDVRTISLNKDTKFILDGQAGAADQLKMGDGIAYITSGDKDLVLAVVKLGLPFDNYRTATQNLVITQNDCIGNPGELCHQGGGIASVRVDMNGELASTKFPDDWEFKTIEGKVVDLADGTVVIKGSSGAVYKVQTPSMLVARFNNADTNRNAGLKLMLSDTIRVEYRQSKGADGHAIGVNELEQMMLMAVGDAKAGALRKY